MIEHYGKSPKKRKETDQFMFEEYPDVLTVDETCEALRIGENAAYILLNNGKLKGFRNGRVWRIPKAALIEFVLSQAKLPHK